MTCQTCKKTRPNSLTCSAKKVGSVASQTQLVRQKKADKYFHFHGVMLVNEYYSFQVHRLTGEYVSDSVGATPIVGAAPKMLVHKTVSIVLLYFQFY